MMMNIPFKLRLIVESSFVFRYLIHKEVSTVNGFQLVCYVKAEYFVAEYHVIILVE